MDDANKAFHAAMGQFQQEVVRWNRQINLVSRQGTLARVAELISQCRMAWQELDRAVLVEWEPAEPLWYFDLGSGGGVPGYVWHQLLAGRFTHLHTWLVEPREKRAWFLTRLNRITPEKPLHVWHDRWGETSRPPAGVPAPKNILISLKALRLSDSEVCAGLARVLEGVDVPAGGRVAITRFFPPEQRWTRSLARELGISNQPLAVGGHIFEPDQQQILSPQRQQPSAAALVLSTFYLSS